MVNEANIRKLVSNHPQISRISELVGGRYILSGFSDEDTVVMAAYFYELIDTYRIKGSRWSDTRQIYQLIGGSTENYLKMCEAARDKGYVNLEANSPGKIYPSLSSQNGADRVYELLGKFTQQDMRIIKAGEKYTAKGKFEAFVESIVLPSGKIMLVDSYVSPNTLIYLTSIFNKARELRILTYNVSDEKKMVEEIKNFEAQGNLKVELKKGREIHDRFIVSEKGIWTIGSSIKDLGNKDSIISEVSSIRSSLKELFEERWNASVSPNSKEK